MKKTDSLNKIEIEFDSSDTMEIRRMVNSQISCIFQLVNILDLKKDD